MTINQFIAGEWCARCGYQFFMPAKINHEWVIDDAQIVTKLELATWWLAQLNAFSLFTPDVSTYIRMQQVREATTSNKIEGTQTKVAQVLLPAEELSDEYCLDWQEVQNYISAQNHGVALLDELPLSIRLLKAVHVDLLKGVPGEFKQPGEVRTSQNWIGGSSPANAMFVPPHQECLPELLSDLEAFWHNEQIHVPWLIRCAISHYQFETIHPFCDGNGRLGRLLNTLFLMQSKLLQKPVLYLSHYLESRRDRYYNHLTNVRERNDLKSWLLFFLDGVIETSQVTIERYTQVNLLRKEIEAYCLEAGFKAASYKQLIDAFYTQPSMTVQEAATALGKSYITTLRMIQRLHSDGILVLSKYSKSRYYTFQRFLEIFE